jgi:predicted nucleotidyltransferase
MRITPKEKEAILNSILTVDPEAKVWLFGSRADDSKKGGDIDLLIESKAIGFKEKQRIRLKIEEQIGEQKIDLTVVQDLQQNSDPFISSILPGALRL